MIVVTGDLHTKLLLHGNSFIDGSTDKRVITNTGVAVSTAQSKYGDSSPYIGYMDEFRVSDIARWTESFTPPTEPYPDSKIEILPGGVISKEWALRRSMMMTRSGGAPISDLPLGALINIGTDGGAGTPNYEIADKDNLVSGGVVLVRKNIYSSSKFGEYSFYANSTLDNLVKTTIYNRMPQKLRNK